MVKKQKTPTPKPPGPAARTQQEISVMRRNAPRLASWPSGPMAVSSCSSGLYPPLSNVTRRKRSAPRWCQTPKSDPKSFQHPPSNYLSTTPPAAGWFFVNSFSFRAIYRANPKPAGESVIGPSRRYSVLRHVRMVVAATLTVVSVSTRRSP